MSALPRRRVLVGDATDRLSKLEAGSVDMVLTSPPYFRLRDYDHVDQLGTEAHVDVWVGQLRTLAQQAARVLVPTGTLWLNLGDSYAMHAREGAPRKSLLLAPERLVLALVANGWTLRNKIIWHKTNSMPISVTDRLACTWEVIYVLARQPRYFFDLDAVRQPHRSQSQPQATARAVAAKSVRGRGPNAAGVTGLQALKARGLAGHPLGKNPGDVWSLATSQYRGDHPAMFPVALATRAIQAGCPERRCRICRTPYRRPLLRALGSTATRGTLTAGCGCAEDSEPGLVLDPFMGAGSTAVAAEQLDRDWLGIELNPAYAALTARRLREARAGPHAA